MPWDGRLDDLPDDWERIINSVPDEDEDGPPNGRSRLRGRKPAPSLGWWRDKLTRYDEYCDLILPPIKYIVPTLFPEGVSLIVGRPKIGKSWLCQQIGCAVAHGTVTLVADAGNAPAPHGDVLYLALEDNQRRLKRRGTKYFGTDRACWPTRLQVATEWRRLDEGGLDGIGEWCRDVDEPRLVIIDTLQRVRAPKLQGQSDYDADMEATAGLMRLAAQHSGLSVLINHHDRKQDAGDVFDTVSGTLGLQGGVDTIAILKKSGQGMTLHIKGRDLEDDVEKAMFFDKDSCHWEIRGEAQQVYQSDRQTDVLTLLREQGPMTPRQVCDEIGGMKHDYARQILSRLAKDGKVERDKGIYRVKAVTPVTPPVSHPQSQTTSTA